MSEQIIYNGQKITEVIDDVRKKENINRLFIVTGNSCKSLDVSAELRNSTLSCCWFHDFSANPTYESVKTGVATFKESESEAIVAIGGGSAMDVAKCIKLFATMDDDVEYLDQDYKCNAIPLIAIPTTAGTGSEATRFAVIYKDGIKQSVTHYSIVPGYVAFYPELLKGLPEYQKKATLFDALCHAVESMWSVNATEESRDYSEKAIKLIMANYKGYLNNKQTALKNMFIAANYAGKAINISQTTAGHAMCYKITSLYDLAHGHAAALCVRRLWPYMVSCNKIELRSIFERLDKAFGVSNAYLTFNALFDEFGMSIPKIQGEELDELVASVNEQRLKNNPVSLNNETIRMLYKEILL